MVSDRASPHEALQEGRGREAVGAMQAGAGHLSYYIYIMEEEGSITESCVERRYREKNGPTRIRSSEQRLSFDHLHEEKDSPSDCCSYILDLVSKYNPPVCIGSCFKGIPSTSVHCSSPFVLTGGEQTRNGRTTCKISCHPATEVVRSGHHRKGLSCHVVAMLQTPLIDAGEATADPVCRAVGDVQVHVGGLLCAHLADDRAAHDVTRGKLGA